MQIFQPSSEIYVTPQRNIENEEIKNLKYIGEVLLIGVNQIATTDPENETPFIKTDTYFFVRWLGVSKEPQFFPTTELVTLSDDLVNEYVLQDEEDEELEDDDEEEYETDEEYHERLQAKVEGRNSTRL